MTYQVPGEASRRLWSQRDFLRLWAGQTISRLGTQLGALFYTAIIVLQASTLQVGLLATAQSLPLLLFGLPAGAWADRLRRRPLLIGADLGRALLLAGVVGAALLGQLRMGHLYLVGFLMGLLSVLFDVSYHAYLPSLVETEELLEGNSKLGVSDSLAEIVGPGLGGWLVQLVGVTLTLLLDSLSYLASALFLVRIRAREPQPEQPAGQPALGREIMAGLRLVWHQRYLRALTASAATHDLFGSFFGAVYGLYVLRELGLSEALLGLTIGMGGLGALLGALVAERMVGRFGVGPTLLGSLLFSGWLSLLIPLAGVAGSAALALALLIVGQLLGDIAHAIYLITGISLRQAITPPQLLARTSASATVVEGAARTLGLLLGGVLGATLGLGPTTLLAALGIQLGALWLLPAPLRRLQRAEQARAELDERGPA